MKKTVLFIALLTALTLATVAQAQVKAGSLSFTPFIGGYVFEGNEELKDSLTYGLRGGYNFTKNFGLEGVFSHLRTEYKDLSPEPDVDAYSLGVEALYHFLPDSRLVPFVAAGGGWQRTSADAPLSDRNKLFLDYGAGLKYFLTENVALRADVRHVLPFNDRYNNLLYTLGVNFAFGGEKKAPVVAQQAAPVAAAPVQVRRDSDGDGVFDDLDRCPGTRPGHRWTRTRCPLDTDRDGVYDYLDKCPGTPRWMTWTRTAARSQARTPGAAGGTQAATTMEKAIMEKGG
jgi:OOP family OmpA-OmpF porin